VRKIRFFTGPGWLSSVCGLEVMVYTQQIIQLIPMGLINFLLIYFVVFRS